MAREHHDRIGVTVAEGLEQPVEQLEKARKRSRMLAVTRRPQQERAKRRRQRQRDDRRQQHRRRERQRKLLVELAGQAAEKRDRNEDGGERKRDRDHGPADVRHRFLRRL